jgi:hypothetical protein
MGNIDKTIRLALLDIFIIPALSDLFSYHCYLRRGYRDLPIFCDHIHNDH